MLINEIVKETEESGIMEEIRQQVTETNRLKSTTLTVPSPFMGTKLFIKMYQENNNILTDMSKKSIINKSHEGFDITNYPNSFSNHTTFEFNLSDYKNITYYFNS